MSKWLDIDVNVSLSLYLLLQVSEFLVNLTDAESGSLGFADEDFILDCEYAGTTCYLKYILKNNITFHIIPLYY